MNLTPKTELDAVNEMLSVIGEAPINSLQTSGVGDAQLAYKILTNAAREVQLVGWHWNTEKSFPILPDTNGFLYIPLNTLKVDTSGAFKSFDLIQRGNRLYDRVNHTFVFDESVTVDLVLMLDFDEMPEGGRNLVNIRAARQFQDRTVGSQSPAYTAKDEMDAFTALRTDDMEVADLNIFTGSQTMVSILDR
jgi:hypothetical protein